MNGSEDNTQETYALKTINRSEKIIKMVPFERGLWNLIIELKFQKKKKKKKRETNKKKKKKSNFERQLNENIKFSNGR